MTSSEQAAERAAELPIFTVENGVTAERTDALAIEDPLEIRIGYGPPENRQRRERRGDDADAGR